MLAENTGQLTNKPKLISKIANNCLSSEDTGQLPNGPIMPSKILTVFLDKDNG